MTERAGIKGWQDRESFQGYASGTNAVVFGEALTVANLLAGGNRRTNVFKTALVLLAAFNVGVSPAKVQKYLAKNRVKVTQEYVLLRLARAVKSGMINRWSHRFYVGWFDYNGAEEFFYDVMVAEGYARRVNEDPKRYVWVAKWNP